MAQTNFTPISLYYSTTASAVPTAANLVPGELAININDGKLYYEDSSGVVQVLATKGGVGTSSTTQVLYNASGLVAGSANLIWDNTNTRLQINSSTASQVVSLLLSNSADSSNSYIYCPNKQLGLVQSDTSASSIIYFSTQNTERARIDSNGSLFVNSTATFGGANAKINASADGTSAQCFAANNTNTGSASQYVFPVYRNGTLTGGILNTDVATSFATSSDSRLKENIVDAPLGNIDGIKVRSFDWIKNGSHQEYGMIAQELIDVAPYAVSKPKNPDEMMGVEYSKLVPMMIKEIQDLKQRIKTLENK